jgi:hypothetical protein
VPVAFSGIGLFTRLEVIDAQFDKVFVPESHFLPLLPNTHPRPLSHPFIKPQAMFSHIGELVIVDLPLDFRQAQNTQASMDETLW